MGSNRRQPWRNHPDGYGWISIFLHGLSALLALGLLAEGAYMVTLTYYDPLYHRLPHWHKVAGVNLLLLTLIRLLWLASGPRPALLPAPRWQQHLARLAHIGLYGLLFVPGLTGYLIATAKGQPLEGLPGLPLPALLPLSGETADRLGALHRWSAYALGALALLHAAAALWHQFVLRDGTLRRMLWPTCK